MVYLIHKVITNHMGPVGETLVKILEKKYNRCQKCIFDIYLPSSITNKILICIKIFYKH